VLEGGASPLDPDAAVLIDENVFDPARLIEQAADYGPKLVAELLLSRSCFSSEWLSCIKRPRILDHSGLA